MSVLLSQFVILKQICSKDSTVINKKVLCDNEKRKICSIEIKISYEMFSNIYGSPIKVLVGTCRKLTVTIPVSV